MSERDLAKLLELVEKRLGAGWIDIADWLRGHDSNSLDAIQARLMAGDTRGVVAEIEAAAERWAADTTRAFTTAGEQEAAWLDGLVKDKLIQFDVTNERAVQRAKLNQLEYVEGFKLEQNKIAQQITQRALVEGTTLGENPRRIARDFRDAIGLTAQQEGYVASYRRALEAGDWSNALRRELSDARSDKLIRRVSGNDGELTDAQIDGAVERYRKNMVGMRAEFIARTETQANVEAGMQEAIDQAVERGHIKPEQLTSEWVPGPDTEHAREDHRDPELLEQRPKHGEDFVMMDGSDAAPR